MRIQENTGRNWLTGKLAEGEYVLWSGKPVLGRIFHGYDAFLIPFSFLWCTVCVYFLVASLKEDIFSLVVSIPLAAVGIYLAAGRFFYDQFLKRNTDYAVTSKRILRRRGQETDFLVFNKIPAVNRTVHRDGTGDITFGQNPVEVTPVYVRVRLPFYREKKREPVFYLEDVPDVETVYQIIEELAAGR